jgi:hypothetical protein
MLRFRSPINGGAKSWYLAAMETPENLPGEPGDAEMQRRIALFRAYVERNKTRRRRDGDPPAAQPVPASPRGRGPFLQGGAAAALIFEER